MQKSLIKALDIIKYLSGSKAEYGISEISEKLGISKSNVHEILTTFEHFGYVRKNEASRQYSLSVRFLEIAHLISKRLGFQDLIRPDLQKISDEIGEITYFGVPDEGNVMYMAGAFPNKVNVSSRSVIGLTAPLYCTGIGKAMLAFMTPEKIDAVLALKMEKFTDATITDPEAMRAELAKIRSQGYSIDNMEHEYGVKCVAVPVLNREGELIGAVSTTGPSLRFNKSVHTRYALLLTQAASNIGRMVNL